MNQEKEISLYEDMINLPHPISTKHPQMAMHDRAAQFSPFAALSGYEEAVAETGRYTEGRIALGDEEITILNQQINHLQEGITGRPQVCITYFLPDKRKSGGSYVTQELTVKKIDRYEKVLIGSAGEVIPFADILTIEEKKES
ncbi:MAG: hypothetical protein HFI72_02300 [Peptococcaceae bacterium]|nr:hypothetical protein [Peptococcaceae bacterium]